LLPRHVFAASRLTSLIGTLLGRTQVFPGTEQSLQRPRAMVVNSRSVASSA